MWHENQQRELAPLPSRLITTQLEGELGQTSSNKRSEKNQSTTFSKAISTSSRVDRGPSRRIGLNKLPRFTKAFSMLATAIVLFYGVLWVLSRSILPPNS